MPRFTSGRLRLAARDFHAGLPRGTSAQSLEDAIAIGFRGGLSGTIAVEPAFVPTGASSASFEIVIDQNQLLDMAGP